MSLRVTIQSPNGGSYAVTFDASEVRVGRASFCELRLPYPVVSSHHLTITGGDGSWFVTDVGSTNGSWVDGSQLPTNRPVPIDDGHALDIGEVRLEFAIVRDYVSGFTLAESGTLLRKLVSESTRTSQGPSDDAFFEVLEGPRVGTRYPVPDHIDVAWAGDAEGCELCVVGLPERSFRIERDGDGFRVFRGDETLWVNDVEVGDDGRILRNADRMRVGAMRLMWFDPLEAYLDDLDPAESSRPVAEPADNAPDVAASEPDAADPSEPGAPQTPAAAGRRRSPLDWFLILVSLGIAGAAIYAITVILRA